ncbi:MAG: DUF1501 domain-containing protein [Verrucomicrobiales bacterium]
MNPLFANNLHLTRREFFGRASTGIYGVAALGSLLDRDGLAATAPASLAGASALGLADLPHFAPKAKRVIYLFQNGAPTHVDLFDYKPKLAELRKPVLAGYADGKRFSTMTGKADGKLMLARSSRFPAGAKRRG